jgi:type II secretory pathway pseudopilin PulG
MKRLIFWLVALAIIALLVAMLLPAETGPTLNKNARCKIVMWMLRAEIKNYKNEIGSYPTGDSAQILKKLFGDNPKQIEFIRPKNMSVNQAGELLDPWGTPYAISFSSTNSFVISSAGKDKIFGDKDDIIFNTVSNDFVKP